MYSENDIRSIVSVLIKGHHKMDVEWTSHFCDKEKYPQPEPEHIILAKTLLDHGLAIRPNSKWKEHLDFNFECSYSGSSYECENCGYLTYEDDFKYCPNCGASMEVIEFELSNGECD